MAYEIETIKKWVTNNGYDLETIPNNVYRIPVNDVTYDVKINDGIINIIGKSKEPSKDKKFIKIDNLVNNDLRLFKVQIKNGYYEYLFLNDIENFTVIINDMGVHLNIWMKKRDYKSRQITFKTIKQAEKYLKQQGLIINNGK